MIERLRRHVPLLQQLQGYRRADLGADTVAGLTTAVMLVPQAMAYAMLAGLEPIVGLYASTLPLALYSLLGSSRQLAVGPVAMVSLLVASGVGAVVSGDPALFAALAALLALMVGVLQWGMGVARLGVLVKLLSHPVIAGFTSGAALIIGASQLKHLLGISLDRSHQVHQILLQAAQRLDQVSGLTLLISLLSVVTLVAMKRFTPRLPRFLVVVVAGTLAVWGLGLDQQGVAIVGAVPGGLPGVVAPPLELEAVMALLPSAITIALVSFMESISVARAFARANRTRVNADQELKALGLANVVGGFIGAYPVTGGFSRTAVNAQAGARSGVAGLITAAVVVVTLLFFTPLFHFLPKGVLAAIILTAVVGLVDLREAKHLWAVSRPDLALMGLTFVGTLTVGIEQGVLIGVAASLLVFVWRSSQPRVVQLGRASDGALRSLQVYPQAETTPELLVVRVEGPMFFANTERVDQMLRGLMSRSGDALQRLVLDASAISSVDAQGLGTLEVLFEDLERAGVSVWVAGARAPLRDALARAGLKDRVGMVPAVEQAVGGGPLLEAV